MPVFREGERPPDWCELEAFAILSLIPGEVVDASRRSPRERLVVTAGSVQVRDGGRSQVYRDGQFVDLASDTWEIWAGAKPAEVVRLSGRWGGELGGCGVFRAETAANPSDGGDAVNYAKTTNVDSHYHDCDEYWIVLDGRGVVVVGERRMDVGPGDCIPIGMGHHHDLPSAEAPVRAVYFETTLEGAKRTGHLWNHTHGPAVPQAERV